MKQEKNGMFTELYLFAYGSKSTMALYYMAFVLLYLILGKVSMQTSVSLDFATALQMMVVCVLIGFGQRIIVPVKRFGMMRCAVWVTWATLVTVGAVLVFKWFDGFPAWCGVLFCALMMFAFAALVLGLLFDSQRETRKLNEHLKIYQSDLQ